MIAIPKFNYNLTIIYIIFDNIYVFNRTINIIIITDIMTVNIMTITIKTPFL